MTIKVESRRFSVAPMLDCTDRHARYLYRLMSRHVLLYTEMMATGALLYGKTGKLLVRHTDTSPVAVQLGGSEPDALARCARIIETAEYNEVNLNLGCPSERVQRGQFGACLMQQPARVTECIRAMLDAVSIPVTVKCRIGVDEQDSYTRFADFIGQLQEAGCSIFIVHARKAWLQGLSPKRNRQVPPLRYDYVFQLKEDFPRLTVVLNGGLKDLSVVQNELQKVDGVMLGRAVYDNPWLLSTVDQEIYRQKPTRPLDRAYVIRVYSDYCRQQLISGVPLRTLVRPLFGLFYGQPGARRWRRLLSEYLQQPMATVEIIEQALCEVSPVSGQPRRLSENRGPTAEKRSLVHFPAHFR